MYVEKSNECCHVQPQKAGHEITHLQLSLQCSTQYRSFTLKNQDNMIEALHIIDLEC